MTCNSTFNASIHSQFVESRKIQKPLASALNCMDSPTGDKTNIPSLETVPYSFGQRIMRIGHYFQARVGNKFGNTVRFLSRYISPGSVLFDIGAHHGKFSKPLAQLHNHSCKVYCFEPLKYNHTLLKTVLRGFKNVKVFPLALSFERGQTSLYVPVKKSSKRIGTVFGHMGKAGCERFFASANDRQVHQVTIQTDTLDHIVAQERLARLDFLKVDVEGAESLVFRGGLNCLARFKPMIYCEIAPGFPERLGLKADDSIRLLIELGYRMFVPDEGTGKLIECSACRPALTDYLFLPPPASSKCI